MAAAVHDPDNPRVPFGQLTIPGRLLITPGLDAADRILLALIFKLANGNHGCYASDHYLSKLVGVCDRDVRRRIARFREEGYVETECVPHTRGSHPTEDKPENGGRIRYIFPTQKLDDIFNEKKARKPEGSGLTRPLGSGTLSPLGSGTLSPEPENIPLYTKSLEGEGIARARGHESEVAPEPPPPAVDTSPPKPTPTAPRRVEVPASAVNGASRAGFPVAEIRDALLLREVNGTWRGYLSASAVDRVLNALQCPDAPSDPVRYVKGWTAEIDERVRRNTIRHAPSLLEHVLIKGEPVPAEQERAIAAQAEAAAPKNFEPYCSGYLPSPEYTARVRRTQERRIEAYRAERGLPPTASAAS